MSALVVHEWICDNTRHVAEAVVEGLGYVNVVAAPSADGA